MDIIYLNQTAQTSVTDHLESGVANLFSSPSSTNQMNPLKSQSDSHLDLNQNLSQHSHHVSQTFVNEILDRTQCKVVIDINNEDSEKESIFDQTQRKVISDLKQENKENEFSLDPEISFAPVCYVKNKQDVKEITNEDRLTSVNTKWKSIHLNAACQTSNDDSGLTNKSCKCNVEISEIKSILKDIQEEQREAFKQSEQWITQLQKENTELKNKVDILCSKNETDSKLTYDYLEYQKNLIGELQTERSMLRQENNILIQSMKTLKESLEIATQKINNKEKWFQSEQIEAKETFVKSPKKGKEKRESHFSVKEKSQSNLNLTNETNQSQLNVGQDNHKPIESTSDISVEELLTGRHHADRKRSDLDDEIIKRNSLKLPQTCKNLLIGDSNMKNVQKRRLDNTGQTDIRTYAGATVKRLTGILNKSEINYSKIEKVSICIGTNDCSRGYVDGLQILDDYIRLIDAAKKVFPTAVICILAIPPQRDPTVNKYIFAINRSLKKVATERNVLFKACDGLWGLHVTREGVVDGGILYDNVHLTPMGLAVLLQNVTFFFFGRTRLRDNQRRNSPSVQNIGLSSKSTESKSFDSECVNGSGPFSRVPPNYPPSPFIEKDIKNHHYSSSIPLGHDNFSSRSSSSKLHSHTHGKASSEFSNVLDKFKTSCVNIWKKYTSP